MHSILQRIRNNWKSGVTVSLVSIPLSVSLAVASGTTPVAGIITAIWAGLVTALFGGSKFNIVGPTGALSGILAAYAIGHGAEMLPMLAIVSGILILVSYLCKFERYLILIPASTIHGFTLGVAAIIALNQFDFAVGISGLVKHERFIENVIQSLAHIGQGSLPTVGVFFVFLAALFAIAKYIPKIPGALILSPIGIFLGYLSSASALPFHLITLGEKFQNISPKIFTAPHFFFNYALLTTAITVAVVAILETMISAKIADNMTNTKHDKRKEMLGLGVANVASGLFGGIPATAALARTSLNIKTGAKDNMSGIINALAIIVVSFIFLKSFAYIPMAVIASILVFVALRMIEIEHFKKMFVFNKRDFFLAIAVAIVTVYEDPIIGILVGVAISLLFLIEKLAKGQFELIINNKDKQIVDRIVGEKIEDMHADSHTLVYSIKGQLAYINTESHIERFENKLNGYENIILRLRELYLIDLEGVAALDSIISTIQSAGKKVYIVGVNDLVKKALLESKYYKELENSGAVFPRTRDALKHLGYQ